MVTNKPRRQRDSLFKLFQGWFLKNNMNDCWTGVGDRREQKGRAIAISVKRQSHLALDMLTSVCLWRKGAPTIHHQVASLLGRICAFFFIAKSPTHLPKRGNLFDLFGWLWISSAWKFLKSSFSILVSSILKTNIATYFTRKQVPGIEANSSMSTQSLIYLLWRPPNNYYEVLEAMHQPRLPSTSAHIVNRFP